MPEQANTVPVRVVGKSPSDQGWIEHLLRERWGSTLLVSRGVAHDATTLPALLAWRDGGRCGLATYFENGGEVELVTLDTVQRGAGVGTALLWTFEQEARRIGASRCVLITSNDNLDALAFYQKRGWRLSALHPGAIDEARLSKPSIPLVGDNGIPIHDELELSLVL